MNIQVTTGVHGKGSGLPSGRDSGRGGRRGRDG
jgi:hypothetical protein